MSTYANYKQQSVSIHNQLADQLLRGSFQDISKGLKGLDERAKKLQNPELANRLETTKHIVDRLHSVVPVVEDVMNYTGQRYIEGKTTQNTFTGAFQLLSDLLGFVQRTKNETDDLSISLAG